MDLITLTKLSASFAKKLSKTFSGIISPVDAAKIIRSYLELDGKSLERYREGRSESAQEFKKMVDASLLGSGDGHEGLDHILAGIIQSYLEQDNQSLDRFLNDSGAGHLGYKALAAKVQAEGTLVLGMPGSVTHTQIKEKRAQQRMALAAKYDWSLYTCQSLHDRNEPQKRKHDGIVNWVRVTLPENDMPHPHWYYIDTPIGRVRADDHLAFSCETLRRYVFNEQYPNGVDEPPVQAKLPAFKRVDLVTPARYDGIRFAPLAIYIGYEEEDSETPLFYILCGGNVLGQSKVLYPSTDLDTPQLMHTSYRPTPFTSPDYYYLYDVKFNKMDPIHVSIKVFTEDEIRKGTDQYHFQINLALERVTAEQVATVDNFIPPAKQVLDAFLRVEELSFRGLPQADVSLLEMQIAMLTQRLRKRQAKGKSGKALEARIKRLENQHETSPREIIQDFLQELIHGELDASHLTQLIRHLEEDFDLVKEELDKVYEFRDANESGMHLEWSNQLGHPSTVGGIKDPTTIEKIRAAFAKDNMLNSAQIVHPLYYFKPTTLNGAEDEESIVAILKKSLATGNTVKAAGSGHSYSDVCTTPDYFIDTHSLDKASNSEHPITGQLSQEMLRDDVGLQLTTEPIEWSSYDPSNNKALFETESGIILSDLNKVLHDRNVGLSNMGGYDGQTIIGAISTSTHGSGITLPPFPDMLKSLVMATTGKWNGETFSGNPDGDEGVYLYRIEPSNGITDPAKYNDPSIQLIQDDDCFNAVICSMGCMGVIYSVVLEVMQMYWLSETRYLTTFDKVMDMLQPTADGGIAQKLQDVRNFEVLVHPYAMDGFQVLDIDPDKPASDYYPYYKCLVTERHIAPEPDNIIDRSGHRNFFVQLMSLFKISFEITVKIINTFPRLTPYIIDAALNGLPDTDYVNRYWKIYTLGLNQDAGFATEIGFSLQDGDNYTPRHFQAAVDKIHAIAQDARVNGLQYQSSPFSLRFVKSSNAHLSMMQGTNTCMIEMDMVVGTYGGKEIMKRYQDNMYSVGGRPHWGLEFDHLTNNNGLVESMYPELDKWLAVYNQFNALGTFNNNFTERVGFQKFDFKRD